MGRFSCQTFATAVLRTDFITSAVTACGHLCKRRRKSSAVAPERHIESHDVLLTENGCATGCKGCSGEDFLLRLQLSSWNIATVATLIVTTVYWVELVRRVLRAFD